MLDEIKKSNGEDEITVSICVITYNQAEYIAQCLESLVSQKTSFPFEIIIRDDASVDNTLNIILDYQYKYPDLIKVLDSSKNIGMNANILAVFNAAHGEYIAICEGDDYWIDIKKLEKQYLILEEYKQVDICCHPVFVQENEVIKTSIRLGEWSKRRQIIPLKELIKRDGGSIATPSIMMRKSIVKKLPIWFEQAPIGDYFFQIYAAQRGGCFFLPDSMAVYRRNRPNSWTAMMSNYNNKRLFFKNFLRFVNLLAKQWQGQYQEEFQTLKAHILCNVALYSALLGIKKEFRIYILLSWARKKGFSKYQKIMYYLRTFPLIFVHFFYKLKKVFG